LAARISVRHIGSCMTTCACSSSRRRRWPVTTETLRSDHGEGCGSVWPVAQQPARLQRAGRYLPVTTTHPAKMLPAIAAHAISAYTRPGDLVIDPMCGIGTTLVEATHLGRDAIGVEYEQ